MSSTPHLAVVSDNEPEEPGKLVGDGVAISIHTKQAKKLIGGRAGNSEARDAKLTYGQVGLISFAKSIRLIQERSRMADPDPYSLYCLYLVEQKMSEAKVRLDKIQAEMEDIQKSIPRGVTVKSVISGEPIDISLQFKSPFAYQMAYLIAGYDSLVLVAETLKRTGLITNKLFEGKFTFNAATPIRAALKIPAKFKDNGIRMSLFSTNNAYRKETQLTYGDIPDEILSGYILPEIERQKIRRNDI